MPQRYVKKQTEFIVWEPPKMRNFNQSIIDRWRGEPYYDLHRPWTKEFQAMNAPGVDQPHIFVQPFRKFPVLRGDRVVIMVGRDKGKQGIVDYVVLERNWVCVEGLNLYHRIEQQSVDHPGSVASESRPLLYPSEVLLVDPTDRQPTEAEWRFDEEGNELRVSVRTERVIPIPLDAFKTYDYKSQTSYVEEDKDTPAVHVQKVTFKPQIKTFEMDIMENMGIKEERVPYPMFWY